jgi:hypothetical protein
MFSPQFLKSDDIGLDTNAKVGIIHPSRKRAMRPIEMGINAMYIGTSPLEKMMCHNSVKWVDKNVKSCYNVSVLKTKPEMKEVTMSQTSTNVTSIPSVVIDYCKGKETVVKTYVGTVEKSSLTHVTLRIKGETEKSRMFRSFIRTQIVQMSVLK